MLKIINLLGGVKGLLSSVGLAAIIISIYSLIIIPVKEKNVRKPLQSQIDSAKRAGVTFTNKILDLEKYNTTLSKMYDSVDTENKVKLGQIQEFQLLIRDMNNTIKANKILISNLQKGIRVDLVTIRDEKGLWGKIKRTDSTYIEGWKYGKP